MAKITRIMDANANRAREALRVMEDAARFAIEDRELTEALRSLRHDLARTLQRFENLQLSRDAPGDVGGPGSDSPGPTRTSAADVVIAAGKRLSEALRSLEEYAKIIDAAAAAAFEQLRYRGYDLEQRLNRAVDVWRPRQWKVCVIFSEHMCGGRDWREVAQAVWDAQPDCIQLREKGLDDAELLRRAVAFVENANQSTVIINDRPDIALLAGAHGVHLGATDLPCTHVRKMAGPQLVIGVSTSTLDEAEKALRDGADYCGLGPMYETATKKLTKELVGPAYVAQFRRRFPDTPHLAIGGITPQNIEQLIQVGVGGVAVCEAVCGADRPGDVIKALREALESAPVLEPETTPSRQPKLLGRSIRPAG